ncbi:trehalose-6-phosphate synthase [Acuticoccus sp. I52.16.1]|uniref:alpha,alpha-trehalose-phosphate synthase (UDP-forming) n=1 Tax=Acuticoccus sp. I52.16.1 TaxID=2928472 RepID=UPI001FD4427D|nr:trehalose-6-phosphate synthase [Acuticoccus sp. I52.16.1]UOM34473.1 trehalose-6-phosphate synthase [Acuticoccus sp. I52.16.1]
MIAVSNRISRPAKGASPGGLAQALSEALRGSNGMWIGWSGDFARPGSDLEIERDGDITFGLVDIAEDTYHRYYEGYANSVLWPLFHSRPDLAERTPGDFAAYRTVNAEFADAVAEAAQPGDTIWVHDYHFLILAEALRARGLAGTIGLFIHIPCPPLDVFRRLAEARTIVRALTAFDTIAVQTRRDAARLAECMAATAEGTIRTSRGGLRVDACGGSVHITVKPIGTQPAEIRRSLETARPAEVEAYLARAAGRTKLIGVDRLDYSKGIPNRLLAYERHLEGDRSRAGSTLFTQIAPPSREAVAAYAAVRTEVERITGRIVGAFGDLASSPLTLLTRPLDRVGVAHMLANADIAMVTPLADGMNLVAKEFVAAQDPHDPGVLVLSKYAGAAEEMVDALIVDPHDLDEMAAAITAARTMSRGERRERHRSLAAVVERTRIERWLGSCLKDLAPS